MDRHVTLFHSPRTRSTGALVLLEELGADYELHVLNMSVGEQRQSDYLAVNPMGKVPAILHGGALVTEQVAVYLYLGDLYQDAKLAPALDDPLRGPYLRWIAFYGSCFEPAIVDLAMKRAPAQTAMCPYGDYDTMLQTVSTQLAQGPYLLGDTFSAADVLWGTALRWVTAFELVPKTPVIMDYMERVGSRPAAQRAAAKDAELLAQQTPPH
ncbi:glutathione S-transferase family protein [Rugamonas sp.]|uniref:glutathione S-transferase family protein n=1 Tax=Rugamonas sp. TaxID=1926287 RepID=UPI0025CDAEA0|nr:glutathione S-transferase family protein [Rugamonas sp.]